MTMAGYVGLTGAYKDSMVQALNDEITFDQMIENIEKDYNDGYTMK
jgi:alpha-1,4-digalacturonate transport system substrate-binding protein